MCGMDDIRSYAPGLTADQYRARAQIVRCTADQMTSVEKRRQLLDIAEEYDWLADSMERARFG